MDSRGLKARSHKVVLVLAEYENLYHYWRKGLEYTVSMLLYDLLVASWRGAYAIRAGFVHVPTR